MINEKEKTVKNMVLSDSAYTMYLYAKLKKSKENIKNGEVIMLDELDKGREAFYRKKQKVIWITFINTLQESR